MTINPLTNILRFGFRPGSNPSPPPTGTDFRHEPHFLSGVPVHMVRFGFQPLGTSGAPPATPKSEWLIRARRRGRR